MQLKLYQFRLYRNDLTAETAENTEKEKREMNNSDTNGFDILEGKMRINKISVTKLFGVFNHPVSLNMEDRITIIHSPNGFGKTALLRLINGFFNSRYSELLAIPFAEVIIDFDDESYRERLHHQNRTDCFCLVHSAFVFPGGMAAMARLSGTGTTAVPASAWYGLYRFGGRLLFWFAGCLAKSISRSCRMGRRYQ